MTGSVDHLHAALLSAQSQFQTLIEAETSRTDASNTAKTAFKIAEASILFLERPHLLSSSQARYERGMLRLMAEIFGYLGRGTLTLDANSAETISDASAACETEILALLDETKPDKLRRGQ